MKERICLVPECKSQAYARGACYKHYRIGLSGGDIGIALLPPMTAVEAGSIGGRVKNPRKGFGYEKQIANALKIDAGNR